MNDKELTKLSDVDHIKILTIKQTRTLEEMITMINERNKEWNKSIEKRLSGEFT